VEVKRAAPLLENVFVRLWQDADRPGLVRLYRTSERTDTLELVRSVWGEVVSAIQRLDRSQHVLLLDFRDAPARNDAAFEQALSPYRTEITRGFRRTASLTRSMVGQLQMQRLAKVDGAEMRTFDNESDAVAWLCAALVID
jgi:hypothetical protein